MRDEMYEKLKEGIASGAYTFNFNHHRSFEDLFKEAFEENNSSDIEPNVIDISYEVVE
jgi:hypothetical protein